MIKKLILFLLLLVVVPTVSATEVFLVSDNPADYGGVVSIAKLLNITVVKTPWGEYSEDVLNKILSLNPERVIIVGGPRAVVDEYVEKLNSAGITVERIGGKDRYETNAKLILKFKNAIRNRVTICICHGYDVPLNETINTTSTKPSLLILTNGVNLTLDPEKLNISIEEVNVVESPLYNSIHIVKKFEKRGLKVRIMKRLKIGKKLGLSIDINVSSMGNTNRSIKINVTTKNNSIMINVHNKNNHPGLRYQNHSNESYTYKNWTYTYHIDNYTKKEDLNTVENVTEKISHVSKNNERRGRR
ncbi:cell wall-binding protein [Methanofervidicoccus sp. A16]|uniref:cell wall-binding repeat-containing protein n=1 Tax=Methanofervidicoccus sp. A16 TaxID=2607662 RepID=UPI0011887F90|nr:cell wall-binding protein [Methanofervidicoccus sp. A16]AXI25596.1 cell wall-binding protein [Methanofervidicoccus sp. A16]